ncbi:hypothetical protein LY90DRAFT_515705 [Neocallimastix californiae]|uniref:Uncharacterized protein n=1 Tax=Neocallimastix californiae TaxID=1754190 RepID=A0A1Y2AHL3_9FUNG|nr:hypothetical protein LY90DRAFT_515705 [Neocallimastix californiae]|eukprot:ORY22079.1 hypothetical protein LY90DRAFT_515705 [Neocallimastix californiae]
MKLVITDTSKPKVSKPEASKPEARKIGTTRGESSNKNNNGGAVDFAAFLNKRIEEFRIMFFNTATDSIEDIIVDQLFGEVEIRVNKKESSSQANVAELRKFEEFLHQWIDESKGKEAAIDNEIINIETYLDEYRIKGKQF